MNGSKELVGFDGAVGKDEVVEGVGVTASHGDDFVQSAHGARQGEVHAADLSGVVGQAAGEVDFVGAPAGAGQVIGEAGAHEDAVDHGGAAVLDCFANGGDGAVVQPEINEVFVISRWGQKEVVGFFGHGVALKIEIEIEK